MDTGIGSGLHKIVFKDGQTLRGRVLSESAYEVVLELAGGGRLSIPRSLVAEVTFERNAVTRKDGEIWFSDANRTRYFYSPSAMLLKKGEAYFSQKELVFSSFAYGVTDNFSVLVGTVAPAWFLGLEGFNGIIGLKAGAPVTGKLHLAGGLEMLVLPGLGANSGARPGIAGLVFGSATFGDSDRHATLSVGKPLLLGFGTSGGVQSLDFITTLSGNYRVHKHASLLTENWVVFADLERGDVMSAHGFGVRLLGERIAADLGFIWFGGRTGPFGTYGVLTAIPLPWVDFTYNFDFGPK